ncbi:MAG: hypothetical protein LBR55_05620 [Bacteroidales bacterium]|nr:hypothetical protein [Bacteroidales bacterium]
MRIVDNQEKNHVFAISGGVVEQSNHKVILLVD